MESPNGTETTDDSEDTHQEPERRTREASPRSSSRTNPDSYTTGGKIALVSAAGLSVSALLPWVSLNLELLRLSTTAVGTDTAGVLTLPVGILIAAGVLYSPRQWSRRKFSAMVVLGVSSSLVGAAYVIDPTIAVEIPQGVSQGDIQPFVNAEIGVYATLLSSIGVTAGSVLARYS